jgi:hypothetical protein
VDWFNILFLERKYCDMKGESIPLLAPVMRTMVDDIFPQMKLLFGIIIVIKKLFIILFFNLLLILFPQTIKIDF